MMLADAAQAVEGKLYILGGGWSVTGPEPSASAIAAYIPGSVGPYERQGPKRAPWDYRGLGITWVGFGHQIEAALNVL